MANMEEKLQAVVSQAESDSNKWHSIVHGNENKQYQLNRDDTGKYN